VIARYKHPSLFGLVISNKRKTFFQPGHQMNSTLVGFSAKPFYRVVTVVVNDSNIYKEIILLDEREG
jgi:hypothetical protein